MSTPYRRYDDDLGTAENDLLDDGLVCGTPPVATHLPAAPPRPRQLGGNFAAHASAPRGNSRHKRHKWYSMS